VRPLAAGLVGGKPKPARGPDPGVGLGPEQGRIAGPWQGLEGGDALGHRHPGMLASKEEVGARRQTLALVERSDPKEKDGIAEEAVGAPQDDPAIAATRAAAARGSIASAPAMTSTRSRSIIAFIAKAEPESFWHWRQWQQLTKIGSPSRRYLTRPHSQPPSIPPGYRSGFLPASSG
jgi:hypothetical protein